MNYVEPIRDKDQLRDVLKYIRETGEHGERNHVMVLMQLYSGLRISDILKKRIRDLKNQKYIQIKEQKTGKVRLIEINPVLKRALDDYCRGKDPDDYLVKSRESYNAPISRQQAWNISRDACEKFGLYFVGTHTWRKTFGYHYYKEFNDIATLMAIYNHSSASVTLRYIGVTQEVINTTMTKMKF